MWRAPGIIEKFPASGPKVRWRTPIGAGHAGPAVALDPETGKVNWSVPFEVRPGLTVPAPRQFGDPHFLTSLYNGPMLLTIGAPATNPFDFARGF